MNFLSWLVRHLPSPQLVLDIARELNTTEQAELDWTINGMYLTAEWDHPRAGQGFFSISPNEQGRFVLSRDILTRARSLPLGVYDTYGEAQKNAEKVAAAIEEQYA